MRREDHKEPGRRDKFSEAMRIFEALSSVDEELLERSEGKSRVIPFGRYAKVVAACLCFVMLGVAAWAGHREVSVKYATSEDCAPEAALQEEMAKDACAPEVALQEEMAKDACAPEAALQEEMAEDACAPETALQEEMAQDDCMPEAAAEKDAMTDSGAYTMTEDGGDGTTGTGAGVYDGEDAGIENQTELVSGSTQELQFDTGVIDDTMVAFGESELRETERLGAFVPKPIPPGYVFESGYRSKDAETGEVESIWLLWTKGMDNISISVQIYETNAETESRIADVSRPETYDVHLYEIPYADSVPDEYRIVFDNPIFRADELTRDIVAARMKSVPDMGDTDTPRGNFAVLFDNVLVEFSGRGDVDSIWNMFYQMIR